MQGYVTRKGRHWYAVVYEGLDPAPGRERRRWHRGGTDRPQAEVLARQLAAQERQRRGDGRGQLTFAGFVARHWLPAKQMQLRPTTIEGYERMLRLHILPELGTLPLRAIRSEAIQNLYGHLLVNGRHDHTGGLSAKTVHEVHSVVRNILDDAVRRGLLMANPARLAAASHYRRDRHRRRKAWNAEELRAFLDANTDRRTHRWFRLAAYTGMRRGELIGLRWRDIDLGRHRRAAGPLARRPHRPVRRRGSQPLAVHQTRQQPAAPQSLSQAFDRTVAASGAPRISLHGLRHTHATLLLKAGVPLKVVSERLGHSTPAFTMATYQHILPGMQADAAATFADLLKPELLPAGAR